MNGGDDAVVAPEEPLQPLEWKFSQVFGERAAGEEVQEGNCLFTCCCVVVFWRVLCCRIHFIVLGLGFGWFLLLWICFGSCLCDRCVIV